MLFAKVENFHIRCLERREREREEKERERETGESQEAPFWT